jgi:hypothetical protein
MRKIRGLISSSTRLKVEAVLRARARLRTRLLLSALNSSIEGV